MKLFVQVKLVIFFCYFAKTSGIRYDFGDGRFYIGPINEFGRPSGHGELHNSSGTLEYEGDFLNGVPHGYGKRYDSDGSLFEGNFRNGHSEGPGNLTLRNGDRFEGDFLELMPHGKVVFTKNISDLGRTNQSNSKYQVTRVEGDYRFGIPHGAVAVIYGEEAHNEAIKIDGTFRMGRPHGHARVTGLGDPSKVIYDGKFLNGHPVELGADPEVDLVFANIQLHI